MLLAGAKEPNFSIFSWFTVHIIAVYIHTNMNVFSFVQRSSPSGFAPCPSGLIQTYLFSGKLSLSNSLHSSFLGFVCLLLLFERTVGISSCFNFLFCSHMFICAWNPKCYAVSLLHWYCLFVFHWRKRKAPHHKVMQLYCCAASMHDDRSSELSQSLCAVPNSDCFCWENFCVLQREKILAWREMFSAW